MDILKQKRYPLNYAPDVLEVVQKLAYDPTEVEVMGSQNLRSQLYAADYDLYEEVKSHYKLDSIALKKYILRFQQIVRDLLKSSNLIVADIKAGLIPQWTVIPDEAHISNNRIIGYDADDARRRLETVYEAGLLEDSDYAALRKRIVADLSPAEFSLLKKDLRFHIVRWTPTEVLQGTKTLPNGEPFTLADAFQSPAVIKVDLVVYLDSLQRFTEFSIIYQFKNGRTTFNAFEMDADHEIRQNLVYYLAEGNYFKVCKRMFSLARLTESKDDLERLNEILTSDIGNLYSIISDCETILFVLENEPHIPLEKIRHTLDGFRTRLGAVYSVNADKPTILRKILSIQTLPATQQGKLDLFKQMTRLIEFFSVLLNRHTEEMMRSLRLLPIPKKYLP
jgi:hypothetical protein